VTEPSLLLLSSSRVPGGSSSGSGGSDLPFAYALDALAAFLGQRRRLGFLPYALRDHDTYTAQVAAALAPLGVSLVGLHTRPDPAAALADLEALFVGGGNSFRLLHAIQRLGLLEPVRARVASGALRYIGSSAGTNMACPSLRTTNDMPILQPASFEAFGLVPFQINPHYLDPPPGLAHMGETREQRLREFLEENDVAVVGLREGAWLERQGARLQLRGRTGARLFERGAAPRELEPELDVSWLLARPARFDVPV
jgi:dipeptidase E